MNETPCLHKLLFIGDFFRLTGLNIYVSYEKKDHKSQNMFSTIVGERLRISFLFYC